MSIRFSDLKEALCKNLESGDVEFFVFPFTEGERPTLSVKSGGTQTQSREIHSIRILHYPEKPQNSFIKVFTGLADLSTITVYTESSKLFENIEINAPLIERDVTLERR